MHCRHPKHLPRSALTSLQLEFSRWHMWNVRAAQGQTRCLLEEKKGHCADHAGAHHGIGGHEGIAGDPDQPAVEGRSEEHTSELQSLMRISYAVFCLKKKKTTKARIAKVYTKTD